MRDSLIGWTGWWSILTDPGWTITGNEIRGMNVYGVYSNSGTATIRGNLMAQNAANKSDSFVGDLWENNSIIDNTSYGLALESGGHTVRRNIITNNGDDGLHVWNDQGSPHTPSLNNIISENLYGGNDGIAIDLWDSVLGDDGITVNAGGTDALSGNQGLDYPVVTSAT